MDIQMSWRITCLKALSEYGYRMGYGSITVLFTIMMFYILFLIQNVSK